MLGIAGGASPEWAGRGMRELAELLPARRWTSLPGQTHAVEAEALVPDLAGFFTEDSR